jgi:precorrin isomerase
VSHLPSSPLLLPTPGSITDPARLFDASIQVIQQHISKISYLLSTSTLHIQNKLPLSTALCSFHNTLRFHQTLDLLTHLRELTTNFIMSWGNGAAGK